MLHHMGFQVMPSMLEEVYFIAAVE